MENIVNKLNELSKSTGYKVEELRVLLEKIHKRYKSQFPTEKDEVLAERSIKELEMRLKKLRIFGALIEFEGVILGGTNPIDQMKNVRAIALQKWEEDPQKAVMEGYTDSEGNPLDWRKEFSTGRANPNYGKPITEQWVRRVYGLARRKEEGGDLKFFRMQIAGDLAKQVEIKYLKPVEFLAVDRSAGSDAKILNLASGQKLSFNYKDENINVIKLIDDFSKDIFVPFSKIPEWWEQNKTLFDPLFLTKADVIAISPNVSASGNRVIEIDDYSEAETTIPMRTIVKDEFLDGVTIGSRVYVFGSCAALPTLSGDGTETTIMAHSLIPIQPIKLETNEIEPKITEGEVKVENESESAEKVESDKEIEW